MHTTVLHNHHVSWTICPSRKLVHPRSSKGVCINCFKLIVTNNFLRGFLPRGETIDAAATWCTDWEQLMKERCWDGFIFVWSASMTVWHCTQLSNQTVVQAVWVGSVATFTTWCRPSIFKLQFFCSSKVCEWWVWFCTLHVDFFADHFDVLALAGADASVEALIILRSSVHSCVCVCVNKIWS